MPFRSEKQRRYLWATNPDIARRWAHEYPQKKKLPMYAHDKKTKAPSKPVAEKKSNSILDTTPENTPSVNNRPESVEFNLTPEVHEKQKKAGDRLIKVELPECDGPTYAGQEGCGDEVDFNVANSQQEEQYVEEKKPELAANSILQKLSTVVAPVLRQKIEDAMAAREGRPPRRLPKHHGFHRYLFTGNMVPPPIGMSANPVPPAQNLSSAQPQNPNQLKPVGGGSHPRHNVINSYGAISVSGNLNGNAAFGAKNSPESLKFASALLSTLREKIAMRRLTPMCPCGCGKKAYGCTCPKTCICRKPGQPCAKYQKKAAAVIHSAVEKWANNAKDNTCSCGCGARVSECKCAASCSCRKKGGSCYQNKNAAPPPAQKQAAKSPAWQRSAGKNEEGGLNAKGRASYNKATGGNLKPPVTEKNPTGERKSRRASFCARMGGMKKKLTGKATAQDSDSRINKALRKWNC